MDKERTIKIFAVKSFTGNAYDSIDNVNKGIFSGKENALKGRVVYYSEMERNGIEDGVINALELYSTNPIARMIEKVKTMRHIQPDYLFGLGGIADLPFIFFRPKNTKYCIVWHNVLSREMAHAWGARTPWWMRIFIFQRADCILSVSAFSAETIRHYFPHKKIGFVLNGIDTNFFTPAKKDRIGVEKSFGIDFSKPLIVNISALNARKRPDVFIEIARKCPEANFLIIGRKVAPWDFIARAKKLTNFKWIPFMERKDIAVLLASADIFLMTSIDEPCAAAIQEAAAAGLPEILSKTGGNPELISDGSEGILVPQDEHEIDGYVNAVKKLISYPAIREQLSHNARQKAETQFSWDAVREHYFAFLNKNLTER